MGVEVQAPYEASTDNHEGEGCGNGSYRHKIGIEVLAPHSVCSDTTSAEKGSGVEGHQEVFTFADGGGGWCCSVFCGVWLEEDSSCLNIFCFARRGPFPFLLASERRLLLDIFFHCPLTFLGY